VASPAWRGQRSRPEDGPPAASASPLLAELGRSLRQAREARGLEPKDLCRRLRIGVEQLIALESGDRARLPEAVFVLAQIRRIAETLQVNVEQQLRELRSSGELDPPSRPFAADPVARPRPAVAEPLAAAAAEQPEAGGGFNPLPLLLGLALLLIGAGALWVLRPFGLALPQLRFGTSNGGAERPDRAAPATLASPAASPGGTAATTAAGAGTAPATNPAVAAATNSPVAPATAAAARPGPATAQPPATTGQPPATAPAATAPAGRRPPAPASPRPPAAATLVITAQESSWLEVRSADDRVLYSGLFKDRASFPLGSGLRVMAGRPDLVSTQLGNRPPRRLGSISEVRWQSFAPRP